MEQQFDNSRMVETEKTAVFSNPALPSVSILMPVRNEADYIKRSLDAVLAQDYPHDRMEIFVIDGMSTDGTREIVANYIAANQNIRLLDNPGRIAPTALNVGLRNATGDVIIRVDGHCEIAPNYARLCVQHLQEDKVDGVGGPMETIGENYVADAIAIAMSSMFGVGGSAFRTGRAQPTLVDSVAFPAYPRQTVEKAGLFDEELVRNQDDEYNYRIRKSGGKLLLSPDIHSKYYSRSTLASLGRQYFQYGYWKVRVMQKHPFQMSLRQFVPATFVAALLASIALAILIPQGIYVLLGVLGLYGIANTIASGYSALKRGFQYIFILPLVFTILHISYGFGFLIGLVKFSRRVNFKDLYEEDSRPKVDDILRRIFEVVVSGLGLLFLSPIFLLIALGIRRDSPGPIFYRGPRAGKNGRNFMILKFRTMYERDDSYRGPKVTAQDDPRITPLGKTLRDTKINELPQLWNVLVGEMSLVGPRPEDPAIVETWPEEVRKEVLSVRPGVTSPASVLYRDEETLLQSKNVMDQYLWEILPSKMRFDQLYVRNRTILSDMDVILWTMIVLLPRLNRISIPEHLLYWGPLSLFINRYLVWFFADVLASFLAIGFAGVIFRLGEPLDLGFEVAVLLALAVATGFSLINMLLGLDRVNWSVAGSGDAFDLALSSGAVTLLLFLANMIRPGDPLLPPSMVVTAGMFSFIGFTAVRYRSRLLTGVASRWLRFRGARASALGERVLIVGAGEAGQFALWLLRNGNLSQAFTTVGIVDDDPRKIGSHIDGRRVIGTTDDIPSIMEKFDVGLILYAIANITPNEQERILGLCQGTSARIIYIPEILDTLRAHFPSDETLRDQLLSKVLKNTTVDRITGAFTHYHFLKLADEEIPRTRRYNRPLSFLLFSISFSLPAKMGQSRRIATQIVRAAAERTRGIIREVDVLGRYNENEFVLMLPETSIEAANMVADRIERTLAGIPVQTDRGAIPIQITATVISCEDSTQHAAALLERARTEMTLSV
ncbi:MAG TPA: sugar transferase [Anaerolineaceae bacterium]|nr:sugar transferase [Anaerolineaceae bacterium]